MIAVMNICNKKRQVIFFIMLIQLPCFPGIAQQIKKPPIAGIAFVQLQVRDIKKAAVFYDSLMGYHLVPGETIANNKNHFFYIPVNQRQCIKLEDGLPPGQEERLRCIAFQTADVEALRLYLQSKGITVPAAVSKEEKGMLSFTVNDPDKHPVVFVQYTSNAKNQTQNIIQGNAISKRILHAGLTIANAQAANSFYGDILGFSEIWRGGASDGITSWINMRVPEGTDYLEYMLVNAPVTRQQLGSLHHIALMVPDMQQAVDTLSIRSQSIGYPVAAPRIGRNNRWQLNLFDPDGTRIELMEPFTMR
jgi:catechol 2,3-dioxygenase-like lactoylglutathione lyase family enzyme